MMIKSFQAWRRLVRLLHAILLLGIPFIKINEQSALRFDIPSLRLYFFGHVLWMDEFFIVLVATLFLTFLIVFVTVVFGRIWCGWLCPQTVISDITGFVEKAYRKGIVYKIAAYGATLLISVIIGASLIWYFVSPYQFFHRLMAWQLGKVIWGFWIVLTAILFLNFTLVRRRFCATVCPYAKAQSMLFDNKTLVIAFDKRRQDECMDCRACVQVCPVNIDIRKGANIACITCAECVDKCDEIFSRKGKKGLINYFFGEPGTEGRIIRQNAVITGLLTVVSLLFLIYLTGIRKGFDVTIIPDYSFRPRLTEKAEIINSFIVSIENRQEEDERIIIKTQENIKITPDAILVKAGELQRIRVIVIGREEINSVTLSFIPETSKWMISKEITLIRP
ncbi:MAG: 4Fe-4S dicluster domain-containing protein [Thermodesulfovibrionales bacterium]